MFGSSTILHNISLLFKWWFTVAPWEQSIRVRAGKHIRLLKEGMYMRIPYVDRVFIQSTKRRLSVIRPQTVTSKDGHVITLSGNLGYEIINLEDLFNTLENPNGTLESIIAASISNYVVTHDIAECKPELIEEHVKADVDLTQFGLGKEEFYVTNFVTTKTYRILTGELPCWSRDGGLSLTEAFN